MEPLSVAEVEVYDLLQREGAVAESLLDCNRLLYNNFKLSTINFSKNNDWFQAHETCNLVEICSDKDF